MFGQNEFPKLATKELELVSRKQAAQTKLKAANAAAGLAFIDGDGASEVKDVVRLKTEISGFDMAIGTVRGRRPIAIQEENRRQVSQIRDDISRKQGELAAIEAKTRKFLASLSEVEGVPFDRTILDCMATTDMGISAGVYETKSSGLMVKIRELEAKAVDLEDAAVSAYGFVDLEPVTRDADVVMAVLLHPSEGPTAEVVQAFLQAAANDQRVPNRTFDDRKRRVRIEWSNGLIDTTASYVYCGELARKNFEVFNIPFEGPTYDMYAGGRINVASGTFKAA